MDLLFIRHAVGIYNRLYGKYCADDLAIKERHQYSLIVNRHVHDGVPNGLVFTCQPSHTRSVGGSSKGYRLDSKIRICMPRASLGDLLQPPGMHRIYCGAVKC